MRIIAAHGLARTFRSRKRTAARPAAGAGRGRDRGLLTKSEDVLAPMINMVVVPLMLLSGIMLPMTLGPGWLQGIARATPFRYIIDAMRGAFGGHYASTIMLEGVLVSVGLAALCLWIASRVFVRENA